MKFVLFLVATFLIGTATGNSINTIRGALHVMHSSNIAVGTANSNLNKKLSHATDKLIYINNHFSSIIPDIGELPNGEKYLNKWLEVFQTLEDARETSSQNDASVDAIGNSIKLYFLLNVNDDSFKTKAGSLNKQFLTHAANIVTTTDSIQAHFTSASSNLNDIWKFVNEFYDGNQPKKILFDYHLNDLFDQLRDKLDNVKDTLSGISINVFTIRTNANGITREANKLEGELARSIGKQGDFQVLIG